MLQAISGHVAESTAQKMVVETIQYRNLAPLYCDEHMRVCGKEKKRTNEGTVYDVWIEGPTGGMAVKGTVRTMKSGLCNMVDQ
jgi:hydroxyacyl-ACP dehydratase HTD2-like protein with hotdog domain